MRIRLYMSLSLLLLAAFCGCGGSAEAEMKAAERARDEARKLHAEELASADFQRAQKGWDRAQAAVKEGKIDSAKVIFATAKINFNKSSDIAKAKRDALTRELDGMQSMISSNIDRVNSDLSTKTLSPRQQGRVTAIMSEVAKGNILIGKLVSQDNLLLAVATARGIQTQIYNAQLILEGRKPVK
jgi:hypothetical protein